jgi:hypothetical protein
MQRLRMRMVCAQCEKPCGQRAYPADPPSRRASDRRARPPCQSCRRPSRQRADIAAPQTPRAASWLLNLTKTWKLIANELSFFVEGN